MGLSFDGTVSLGTIIEVGGFIGAWIWTASTLSVRLTNVEQSQKIQTTKLDSLTQISTMQARFDERMASIRRDVDELRRGKGFIKREVEGEYLSSGKIE